jgi:hypothetical protein
MKTWRLSFNIYLSLLAILCLVGCKSDPTKTKKELSTIRFHMEVHNDGSGTSGPIYATRQRVMVNIDKEPFLLEGDVSRADLVEGVGGFAIQVAFNARGTLRLDMMTSSYRGQRIAILCQYPSSKHTTNSFSRWVAAPIISKRIPSGVFVFTPDCTQQEAERIVRGLNNVAEISRKEDPDF